MKNLLLLLLPFIFACQGPKTSQPSDAKTDETVITYNLNVEGMTCTGCEKTIQTGLATLDGVTKVEASHETGLVAITINPEKADTAAIRNKVTETGYTPVGEFKLLPN